MAKLAVAGIGSTLVLPTLICGASGLQRSKPLTDIGPREAVVAGVLLYSAEVDLRLDFLHLSLQFNKAGVIVVVALDLSLQSPSPRICGFHR